MNDHNIRICMVAPLPPPTGGIGRWTSLVTSHARSRSDVSLHLVNTNPYWFRKVHDNSTWKRIIGGGGQLIRDVFWIIWVSLFRKCHVIHMTTSGQFGVVRDLCVMLVGKILSVPVVYHIRFGRVPEIANSNTYEWKLMAGAMKLASAVIAIDKATECAISLHLPKVHILNIPNCINLKELPITNIDSNKRSRTAIFVGWIVQTKGVEELLSAWSSIPTEGWCLELIGPISANYQQKLFDSHKLKNVKFWGETSHEKVLELLANADLFILPSYSEGFPNVVLEAMSLGKAIIASGVGAIPEMLGEECGIVIPPKDSITLSKSLIHVMADPQLRADMGSKAKLRAISSYSIEAVFNRYMSAWKQVSGKE